MANEVKSMQIPSTINTYADCPTCGEKILVTAYVNSNERVTRKCPSCKALFEVPPVTITI